VFNYTPDEATGSLTIERADVLWSLSVRQGEPKRVFKVNHDEVNLTNGFTDLHTETYKQILAGNGFGIEDARPAIRLVEAIRNACK